MTQKKIIIITAPSGSGKSSLIKLLMKAIHKLSFSISSCTRTPRDGEKNGIDYHFISVEAFEKAIHNDEFLEWEMVYKDKYYGTQKSELNRIWEQQNIPLVDIDVKGALNVQSIYRANALSVFIQAPSLEVLKQRLENRGTETPETLKERLDKAAYELSFANQFDHIVVNDKLEIASQELINLVNKFLQ